MRTRACLAAALAVVLGRVAAWADPIIVDIDATLHDTGNPVFVTLPAGTYSVTPIGIGDGGAYDAWNPWGDTSCTVPSGCPQTIPTTEIGWKFSYDVISDAIGAASVDGTPLEPEAVEHPGNYWVVSESAPDRYHVDNETVYPSAADALASSQASTFTLTEAGPVGFAIRDGVLYDNLEGMSLEVVPEPSATLQLGAGIAALFFCRVGKRRPRSVT
jgi:hypothetical protein